MEKVGERVRERVEERKGGGGGRESVTVPAVILASFPAKCLEMRLR